MIKGKRDAHTKTIGDGEREAKRRCRGIEADGSQTDNISVVFFKEGMLSEESIKPC